MDLLSIVVPVKIDATVFLTVPIFADHIKFLQYVDEILRVLLAYILHSKIIHY